MPEKQFLQFLWNSGILLFSGSLVLDIEFGHRREISLPPTMCTKLSRGGNQPQLIIIA